MNACVLINVNIVRAQKKVIETKSVEYMPFYLSFFSFLASSLWLAYGLLSHDLFLAVRFFTFLIHSFSII